MFFKDNEYANLPWLDELKKRFETLVREDQCPHALLLHGPAGTGRRHLALSIASAVLEIDTKRLSDPNIGHPDFKVLQPVEGKNLIGVDPLRELLGFLTLTSHGNRGRVAVVYPAESMTIQTSNALLKTLEEPRPGTVIILVSESLNRFPATVVSRCQRVRVSPPDEPAALRWLAEQEPEHDFAKLLEFSGGAPVRALELFQSGFTEFANTLIDNLNKLERKATTPGQVAASCKGQPDLALQLLDWRLAGRIRSLFEKGQDQSEASQHREVAAGFRQMAQIRDLRRVINGGINAELSLAGLLLDWYGGFGRQRNEHND